jgi:diguanylate cyclase (GGDEF)-like protein/PAS domain S-box-containing protein
VIDALVQGRRSRAAIAAALLFAAIFVLRLSVGTFADAITFLYVIPTVLVAISYGVRAGLTAGVFSFALFLLWALAHDVPVTTLGYVDRALVLLFIGGLVGRFAERLRALEAESTRHFSLSEDMICTAGFDGYFKRVNPAFERVLGYTEAELLATPFVEFVHPDDREKTTEETAALVGGGGTHQFRNRYLDKQGNVHWLEWATVAIAHERRIYAVARDVTDRKAIEEDLEQLSRKDALTGLLNRRSFDEALKRELAYSRRYGQAGALLMVDVDHLKRINDKLGHVAGDHALRKVAGVLNANLRETDVVALEHDSVAARLGGDEFAVLLPGTDAAGAKAVAERLVSSIASVGLRVDGQPVHLGISVGTALYDERDHESAGELLDRADRAMYVAKARGGTATVDGAESSPSNSWEDPVG